jgi:tetratricopeptide (TPR) repeat protein
MPRDAFTKAGILAKLITRAYLVQNVLPDRQANPRVQPLSLPDHLINEQTIELHDKGRVLGGLDDLDKKAGAIAFSRQTTKMPDGLRIVYRLDTGPQESVSAKEAEAVYALSDTIKDELGTEFYLDKAPRSPVLPKGVDAATWTRVKPDLEKIGRLMQKTDEPSRLEALSALTDLSAKVTHPSPIAGMIDGLKGAILSDLRRPQAALAAFRSATDQFDDNPEIFRLWIGYELDLGTGETITKAFQRTARVQPKIIAALDKQWVLAALEKARSLPPERRQAAREDICIVLAETGWQQDPRTAFGANMLGCAIIAHSLRGDLAAARAGLAKDPPNATLLALAIDRRHRALWPDVDRLGRDGFRKNLEHEAAVAAAAAKAAPKDYMLVIGQMQALRALGRFQDALAIGKPLADDKAQIEVGGSDAFWLVNEVAADQAAVGRIEEAIKTWDGVIALGMDRYPELSSLAINRAEAMLAAGYYQAALDSLATIETHADQLAPYGKMWVWANQACSLRALGRDDQAKAAEAKLAAKPDDNWSAVTVAAACRNDVKAVADILITRLRDSEQRTEALGLIIQFAVSEAPTPQDEAVRRVLAKARALPEVQAEFAKYGRVVRSAGTSQGWSDF